MGAASGVCLLAGRAGGLGAGSVVGPGSRHCRWVGAGRWFLHHGRAAGCAWAGLWLASCCTNIIQGGRLGADFPASPALSPPFPRPPAWRRLDAPFGTEDNPVVVPSEFGERIVGVADPDDDSLVGAKCIM